MYQFKITGESKIPNNIIDFFYFLMFNTHTLATKVYMNIPHYRDVDALFWSKPKGWKQKLNQAGRKICPIEFFSF